MNSNAKCAVALTLELALMPPIVGCAPKRQAASVPELPVPIRLAGSSQVADVDALTEARHEAASQGSLLLLDGRGAWLMRAEHNDFYPHMLRQVWPECMERDLGRVETDGGGIVYNLSCVEGCEHMERWWLDGGELPEDMRQGASVTVHENGRTLTLVCVGSYVAGE